MMPTELPFQSGASPRPQSAWRNPWVRGWIAMVLVVLAANAVMISLALKTNPGLVTEQYYDKGQNYGQYLERKQASDALNWQVKLDLPPRVRAGYREMMRVVGMDERGLPLNPDRVQIHFYRPSDASRDFTVALEEFRPGIYQAEVSLPLAGVWDVIASVEAGEYRIERSYRLHVQRP